MNYKKILFPTDFYALSQAALPVASALANESNAVLLITHVEEPAAVYGAMGIFLAMPGHDMNEVRAKLHSIQPANSQVAYEHHLLKGEVAPALHKFAAEQNVDLILMATHGHSGLKHLLLGSTAELVVRGAPCPVLTFRPDQQHLVDVPQTDV